MPVDYNKKIITIGPGKRSDQTRIRGMRITVCNVLEYPACGMSERELLEDLPDLTHEDILASSAFGAEPKRRMRHPQEI